MKLLLVYPPFCTPATLPYSITYLSAFLKENCDCSVDVLDLNVKFHNKKFGKYADYYKNLNDLSDYNEMTKGYDEVSRKVYSDNNRLVVDGKNPELFDEMLSMILEKKPDTVAFSVVYSSQVFYCYALIRELKGRGIKTIVGGPSVNEKLIGAADEYLKNEVELLESVSGKADHDKLHLNFFLDYNVFDPGDYFVKDAVLPLRTSSGCYHAKCTFCTHHTGNIYLEYSLENIERTVENSDGEYFFVVDDMLHKKRLLDLAEIMKKNGKKWTCQLKPTKDYDEDTLHILRESGLLMIIWGVESGCDRVLEIMGKGTNAKDVSGVLSSSSKAGIKNVVYIIFGFPTETKEEFLETIRFLEDNSECIDLVSTSVFGLQKGSFVYADPSRFGVTEVVEEERTVLDPKISYEVKEGLTNEEAVKLRNGYKKTIEKINKFPKLMNYFREHMLVNI